MTLTPRRRAIRDVLAIIDARIIACAESEVSYGQKEGYGSISCATERSARLELMHVRDLIEKMPARARQRIAPPAKQKEGA